MKIYCCTCKTDIDARLTNGKEIYSHREDLAALPFWKCDTCGNTVGCHHKTKNPTRPLGVIPSPEIKAARQHLHKLIDPIWQSGRMTRKEIYRRMGDELGCEYHTAEIRDIETARKAYRVAFNLSQQLI